ncbi:MAG: ABC transporter substrate-binding protein [bacterium]|nr:ABC transporter substrate-binding protein [bacterium]
MNLGSYRLRHFKWVAILAVLAMVATACGGDDAADETPATQATQAPATEATQAATTTTEAMMEESGEEMHEEGDSEEAVDATLATEGTTTTVAPGLVRPQVLEDIPFVFSNIAQTASLDPAVAWSSDGMLFVRSAYDTLLEYPPGSQPAVAQPALASEWSTEDGLTYTFTLRDDVNFHDGNSFDSTDVVRSLERIQAIGQGPSTPLRNVVGYEATGPYEVQITLGQPDTFFTGLLPKVPIVSAEAIEANATADDPWAEAWFAENEAGSGPYVLDTLAADMITLNGFTDYWRPFEPGTPTRVTLRTDPDASTAVLLMCQGEVDSIGGIGPDLVDQAVACEGVKALIQPRFGLGTVVFNQLADGPISDVRVRKAIALAVDYDGWISYLNGRAEPTTGPLPPNAEIGPVPDVIRQDLDQARALMAEAGYPDGGPDNILFTISYAGLQFLSYEAFFGTLITENLKEIGIGVDVQLVGWPELVQLTKSPETTTDLAYLILNMTSTDPSTVLKSAYVTEAWADEGGYNWAYYSNEMVDELTAGVSGITDDEERGLVLRQIQDQIIADQVAIWMPQPIIYQPVLEKWDLLFEPLDFVVQTRFFHARNTEMGG